MKALTATAKPEPISVAEQLRQQAARGVSGYLIGAGDAINPLLHDFTQTNRIIVNNGLAKGIAIVATSAGQRGPMLTVVGSARRFDTRFGSGLGIPAHATLEDANAWRWFKGEVETLTALQDVRAVPCLVLVEPSLAHDPSHERRQDLDRLASECSCVVAVFREDPEAEQAQWRPGLFDTKTAA